jgi:hypothetical protein
VDGREQKTGGLWTRLRVSLDLAGEVAVENRTPMWTSRSENS